MSGHTVDQNPAIQQAADYLYIELEKLNAPITMTACLVLAKHILPTPDGAAKLYYVKRWRTLVSLPTKYADEIMEALSAPPADSHAELVKALEKIVAAYDSGNLQMRSPEIGEPENGIPYHEWHEEWLHHARTALATLTARKVDR